MDRRGKQVAEETSYYQHGPGGGGGGGDRPRYWWTNDESMAPNHSGPLSPLDWIPIPPDLLARPFKTKPDLCSTISPEDKKTLFDFYKREGEKISEMQRRMNGSMSSFEYLTQSRHDWLGESNDFYEPVQCAPLPADYPPFPLDPESYYSKPLNEMPPGLRQFALNKVKKDENLLKYQKLLAGTECFYAGEWKESDMRWVMNGVTRAPIGPCTISAAKFAVSFLNKEGEQKLKLKKLIRVNWHYLGCGVYFLTMEASDNNFYEAVAVISSAENKRHLKYIRPAKYYPEIPAHLHHLIGPASDDE